MKRKPKNEFLPFDNTMRGRLNVPHGEVEANLDAEKKEVKTAA